MATVRAMYVLFAAMLWVLGTARATGGQRGTSAAFDPRPAYHFYAQSGWINDPNGPFAALHDERVHLMYQFNPDSAANENKHWGHAVSSDMVHWELLPVALSPGPENYDQDGVWSGSATVVPRAIAQPLLNAVEASGDESRALPKRDDEEEEPVPVVMYTGVRANDSTSLGFMQSQAFAVPTCFMTGSCAGGGGGGDANFSHWSKVDGVNPFLSHPPAHINLTEGFRDPSTAWARFAPAEATHLVPVGAQWVMLIGGGVHGTSGAALAYVSTDFVSWQYYGNLYSGGMIAGTNWECPDFFVLGGPNGTAVLKISVDHEYYDVWAVGRYNAAALSFQPHVVGVVDFGMLYASKSFALPDSGRRVLWGWVREADPEPLQLKRGWAGVMALPREVTVTSRPLVQLLPIEELKQLHEEVLFSGDNIEVDDTVQWLCEECCTAQAFIDVVIRDAHTAHAAGLFVLSGQDLTEYTPIYVSPVGTRCNTSAYLADDVRCIYDPSDNAVIVNATLSSASDPVDEDAQIQSAPVSDVSNVHLLVYVDHSVIEVFADNGTSNIVTRVYPSHSTSTCIALFAEAGAATFDVNVVQMGSIWASNNSTNETTSATPSTPSMTPPFQPIPEAPLTPGGETTPSAPSQYSTPSSPLSSAVEFLDEHIWAIIVGVVLTAFVVIMLGGALVVAYKRYQASTTYDSIQ